MRWMVHVVRMPVLRNTYRISVGKHDKRPIGRHRSERMLLKRILEK